MERGAILKEKIEQEIASSTIVTFAFVVFLVNTSDPKHQKGNKWTNLN
jgi:hypothetical protein